MPLKKMINMQKYYVLHINTFYLITYPNYYINYALIRATFTIAFEFPDFGLRLRDMLYNKASVSYVQVLMFANSVTSTQ